MPIKFLEGKKSFILITVLLLITLLLYFLVGRGTAFILMSFFTFITAGHILIKVIDQKYNNKYIHLLKIASRSFLLITGILAVYILTRVSLSQFSCEEIPENMEVDYLIVLGSGLKNGDELSEMLENRLIKALEVLEEYPNLTVIVSGGQGEDELISEAEAMANYLIENGISEAQIILENESRSTRENLFNSVEKIDRMSGQTPMILVSSDFHLFRAKMIAEHLDLQPTGVCSSTDLILKGNYMIREIPAVVNDWWRF